jgi:hypothetical protein
LRTLLGANSAYFYLKLRIGNNRRIEPLMIYVIREQRQSHGWLFKVRPAQFWSDKTGMLSASGEGAGQKPRGPQGELPTLFPLLRFATCDLETLSNLGSLMLINQCHFCFTESC